MKSVNLLFYNLKSLPDYLVRIQSAIAWFHLLILHWPFDFLTVGGHKFCDPVFMLFLFVIIYDSSSLWLVKLELFLIPCWASQKGIISYLLTLHMISQSLLSYPLQIPCISLLPLMWCQLLFLFHNKSADLDNLQPLSFFQTICMNTLNRISRSNKSFRASVVIFSFAVDCSGTQFYGKIWFGWFTLTSHFISQSNIWKKVAALLTVLINHLCTFQM